MSPLYVEM